MTIWTPPDSVHYHHSVYNDLLQVAVSTSDTIRLAVVEFERFADWYSMTHNLSASLPSFRQIATGLLVGCDMATASLSRMKEACLSFSVLLEADLVRFWVMFDGYKGTGLDWPDASLLFGELCGVLSKQYLCTS